MRIIYLLLLFILPFTISAQNSESSALDVSVTYASFQNYEQSYIELYYHVFGRSVSYRKVDSINFQGNVDVLITFSQGEQIVKYDKYRLNSPIDTVARNFYDCKRYSLQPGLYDINIEFVDSGDSTNRNKYETAFEMAAPTEGVGQSDITLLRNYYPSTDENVFVKHGYFLEALPYNFCDKHQNNLIIYNELYNTDKAIGADYLLSYYIERIGQNDKTEMVQIGHSRKKPVPIDVILLKMDITELKSGEYNIVVEVKDRDKKLLSKKRLPFVRSNPYLDVNRLTISNEDVKASFVERLDSIVLRYSLKAIAMNVPDRDVEVVNLIIQNGKIDAMRRYIFAHFIGLNPNKPQDEYVKYMKIARSVDANFKSGFGYGFESDRGRIYMKYGAPNDIVSEDQDPSAPPYEIWIYNHFPTTRQSNVKFLFYSPSLALDYRLLHSNAIGELNDPQWQLKLYSQSPGDIQGGNYIDGTQMQQGVNRNASRWFSDF